MIAYLTLARLRVQAANMYTTAFMLGGPPVLPAYFMAHALGRQLDMAANVRAVAFVVHHLTPLGEQFYGLFKPQQRRGAAYTFGPQTKGSDYSSKNAHALSLQPVAHADMEVSLIIGMRDLNYTEGIQSRVQKMRFAGGFITHMRTPTLCENMEEALHSIGTGYVVMDKRDMLKEVKGSNHAERLINALGHKPGKDDGMAWLSATCIGYAAITPFARRAQVREGYFHAFAEPLVGLVQYVPVRQCVEQEVATQTLWWPEWVQQDVFRLYQKI